MKLALILFTLIFLTKYGKCDYTSWSPSDILQTIANKTTQITYKVSNYVIEKGRSMRKFYADNVRNRVRSILSINETTTEMQERVKRKFKEYITVATTTEKKIFDVIAPEKLEHNCLNDNPVVYLTTPQLIAMNGYPAESHTVVTEDGYILTIHRIPFSKKSTKKVSTRKTVFLHHGVLGSSADWILAGPQKGLAYILSDAGYDVWMANARGNTYSKAHVSLNVDTFDFWNFTFHDISQHDLPAAIDYIMEVKGWDTKINYIGHSMGTTVLFALLSTKTQYNKILRAGLALAPVAYMSDVKSPIRLLARFADNLEYLLKLLGANQFLPHNSVIRWLSQHACEINNWEEAICENSLFVLCGFDSKEFNRSLLPTILGHLPAGASTKTLVHYAQEIRHDGNFQQFDYGVQGNFEHYGRLSPPEYPLHNITLPIALLSAQNDWLASEIDVAKLFMTLGNAIENYVVPMKEFNHIDFLWANDAPKLVYSKLLTLLEEKSSITRLSSLDNDIKRDINLLF